MAKRRKPRTAPAVAAEGPLSKFQMKSGRYEPATHADPDRPMFEEDAKGVLVQVGFHERVGMRALEPLDRIGGLSKRAMEAGRKFRGYWGEVYIGRTPDPDRVGGGGHPAFRTPHGESVSHANGRLLQATRVLGKEGWGAVNLCVIEGRPLAVAYAMLWPGAPEVIERTAGDRVLAALAIHLERLADAWGL